MLSVIAVGVQVTMILTLVGVSHGMLEDSNRRAQNVGADILVKPPSASLLSFSGASMPEAMVDYFRKQPHVADALGTVVWVIPGGITSVTGLDLATFNRFNGGFKYLEGGPFRGPDDLLVDEYYRREKKAGIGSWVKVSNHPMRIVGVIASGKLARLAAPLKTMQGLIGSTGKISQVWLKVDNAENINMVIAQLKANPQLANYGIYSMPELAAYYSVDSLPSLKAFIYVVMGLSVVVGFLVVFLSMYTAVLERTREIGVLKALGASPAYILNILFRETLVLALIGWAVGILLAYGTRWAIMTLIPASLTQDIVYIWWPIAGAIAIAGALLGALYPGLKAARQDAIEALSYE
jgi:putative ABC transport system permease protein